MAIPVTWKNVPVPSNAAEYDLMQKSSELLGKSLSGIGDSFTSYKDRKEELDTNAFIAELSAASDAEERAQMIAAANDPESDAYSGFINMKAVTARDDQLLLQDYAAADEARKVAAETFTRSLDESTRNKAELDNAIITQKLEINEFKETRDALEASMKGELDSEKLREIQIKLDHLDAQLATKQQKLDKDLEVMTSTINKDNALIAHYGNLGNYYRSSSEAQDALTEERKAKNKKAEREEATRVRHAENFEEITVARELDDRNGHYKAGGTWYNSAEAKAYTKAFRANRRAGSNNAELRAQFAETVAGLGIQISPEILTKAGVMIPGRTQQLTVGKEGEVGFSGKDRPDKWVFNPSTQQELERLLAKEIKKNFKGPGVITSDLLKEMAKTAIHGVNNLREGFGDAAALAKEKKGVRDTQAFDKAMRLGVMDVNNLKALDGQTFVKPGETAFGNAIKNLKARLVKMPGASEEAIDAGLQKLIDKHFVARFKTQILIEQGKNKGKLDPEKWKKFQDDHGINLLNIKAGGSTYSTFTAFEANLADALKDENLKASPIAVADKLNKIIRKIPGYATAKLTAAMKQKSLENIQKVQVEHEGKLEQARSDLELIHTAKGAIAYNVDFLLKNYPDSYADMTREDLVQELLETRENLHKAYPELVKGKDGIANRRAISELDHILLKMYSMSSVDTGFFTDEVSGVPGTRNPWWWFWNSHISISALSKDQLRTIVDPYLDSAPTPTISGTGTGAPPDKAAAAKTAAANIIAANQPGSLSPNAGIQAGAFKTPDVPPLNPAFEGMSAEHMWGLFDEAVEASLKGKTTDYSRSDILNHIYRMYPDSYKRIAGTDTPPWEQ